ncbi:MAG: hypothetical protein AAF500_19240 [Myxococcota bacterium]
MRVFVLALLAFASCAEPEPVQDPLDYLRVGIDPSAEANEVIVDLQRAGYTLGRKVVGTRYAAFGAARGADSTVRILTSRGPSFVLETPDVRTPRRVRVALAPDPWPDFDDDGEPEVVVESREFGRTCLLLLEVGTEGFVARAFAADRSWGDAPCVLALFERPARLRLEVRVPGARSKDGRVVIPLREVGGDWVIDRTREGTEYWDAEVQGRHRARAEALDGGLVSVVERIDAELAWIDHIRALPEGGEASEAGVPAGDPVLEPAGDGEEAR